MRFVVYGAGAVGGVVGAHLFRAGHDVTLIARGAHLEAIRHKGLRVDTPDTTFTVPIPAVGHPAGADLAAGAVVLLAVKSQDTRDALDALAACAPPDITVVCVQNGVDNERAALRRFARVYGVTVMLPSVHLEPGVVQAYSSPTPGLLDVGRYPDGLDATAEEIAAALRSAGFGSQARPDIMAWKHNKLLMNLGNAAEALCGPLGGDNPLVTAARAEGVACLQAAGIPFVSDEDERRRRGDALRIRPINGQRRGGGSSWQSLARGTGAIEADHLNGEVVLLGRLAGVPTPVNEVLQRLANDMARDRRPPGTLTVADILALVDGA